MLKRDVGLLMGVLVFVAVTGWLCAGAAFGKEGGEPPAGPAPAALEKGAKEAPPQEVPPGWEQWSEAQRKEWTRGLEQARNAVSEHARAREKAALRALEMAARRGAPVAEAEQMVKIGLDEGLAPADFEPLGQTVSVWAKQGITGQELAARVRQEVQRRRHIRTMMRGQGKGEAGRGKPEKVEFIHRKPPEGKPAAAGEGEEHGKGGKGEGRAEEHAAGGKGRGKGKGGE